LDIIRARKVNKIFLFPGYEEESSSPKVSVHEAASVNWERNKTKPKREEKEEAVS
jgi:hypothetical protein